MAEDKPQSIESLVADFTSGSGNTASEAVMAAVAHPDAIRVIKAFQEKGFDVNSQNGYHETVLNAAIGSNHELVMYLLSQGAHPNYYYQGTSPLSNAAVDRDVPALILSELLAYGANTDNDPALHWAAAAGSFEKAKILLSNGMSIKALCKGPYDRIGMAKGTALHEAAGAHYAKAKEQRLSPLEWDPDEQVQLVKLLLDAGADPQSEDDQGKRPEDWIVKRPGFKELVCKRLVTSDGTTFNETKHLERIKSLLRNVGNDRLDAEEA